MFIASLLQLLETGRSLQYVKCKGPLCLNRQRFRMLMNDLRMMMIMITIIITLIAAHSVMFVSITGSKINSWLKIAWSIQSWHYNLSGSLSIFQALRAVGRVVSTVCWFSTAAYMQLYELYTSSVLIESTQLQPVFFYFMSFAWFVSKSI